MKKLTSIFVAICIFCTTSLVLVSCGAIKHNVILVLVEQNGTETRKKLTSLKTGEVIDKPENYENYISLMQGYVRVGGDYKSIYPSWYYDNSFKNAVTFTLYDRMPNKDLELYTPVQALTDINKIKLKNFDKVEEYFSSISDLQGYLCSNIPDGADKSLYEKIYEGKYYKKPDVSDDKCYYEVDRELFKARCYPASKKVEIQRTYRQPFGLGNGTIFTEYFTFIAKLDFINNSIVFMGEYERTGAGKVSIIYNIEGLGLEYDNQPFPPNFNTVSGSCEIISAKNLSKMKELWLSDGTAYAGRCYQESYHALWWLTEHVISLFGVDKEK